MKEDSDHESEPENGRNEFGNLSDIYFGGKFGL
jgi:hypothetical protein